MDNHADRKAEIMLIAFLMGTQEVKSMNSWGFLRTRFLKHYKKDILDWYGYEPNDNEPVKRVRVENTALFVKIMATLKAQKIFGEISYVDLSVALSHVFELNCSPVTLVNKLKDEKKDCFDDVFQLISGQKYAEIVKKTTK